MPAISVEELARYHAVWIESDGNIPSTGPAIRPCANQFTTPFEQTEDLIREHVAGQLDRCKPGADPSGDGYYDEEKWCLW